MKLNQLAIQAFAALFLTLACGASDEPYEAEFSEPDDEVFSEEEVQLATTEQAITVQQLYGFQKSGSGRQLRCVAGAASDCMAPEYKKLKFSDFNGDGISLNADRAIFEQVFNAEIAKAEGRDNGMSMTRVNGGGIPSDAVLCTFRPQASFTPASTSASDIRKYVGGYTFSAEFDHGSYSNFEGLIVRGNFEAMKTHMGGPRNPDGSCINSAGNPACVRGMRHMAQAFIAACAGSGLTSNSGANGTGVDIDVTSTNTADFATTGDVCRQKAYNNAVVGVTIQADSCGGAGG
jgi:hypothetical protein